MIFQSGSGGSGGLSVVLEGGTTTSANYDRIYQAKKPIKILFVAANYGSTPDAYGFALQGAPGEIVYSESNGSGATIQIDSDDNSKAIIRGYGGDFSIRYLALG